MFSVSLTPAISNYKPAFNKAQFSHKKDVNYAVAEDKLPEGAALMQQVRPVLCSHQLSWGLIGATVPYKPEPTTEQTQSAEETQDFYLSAEPADEAITKAFEATGRLRTTNGKKHVVVRIPKQVFDLVTVKPTH